MHLSKYDRLGSFIISAALLGAALFGGALGQADSDQGAVAALYEGSTDCNPANRGRVCTWMYPNTCCTDWRAGSGSTIYWYTYHSASMYGIENLPDGDAGWSIGLQSFQCLPVLFEHGNGCLNQGGARTVVSAHWYFCKNRAGGCITGPVNATETAQREEPVGCKKMVAPDVVFIREKAGEEGRPFAEGLIYRLNTLGKEPVVDLETLTVKEGMVERFRELVEVHGDGLSRAQMRAMRVLADADAKRGVLTPVMERFMGEEL